MARAYDRGHHYSLRNAGADYVISETYHSALNLGTETLKVMGIHPFKAEQQKASFMEIEAQSKNTLYEKWIEWTEHSEDERYAASFRELFMEFEDALSEAMKRERGDRHSKSERGWTPPPKVMMMLLNRFRQKKKRKNKSKNLLNNC